MKKLFVAGSGIKFLSHLTFETLGLIKQCDCVCFLVNDPAMKKWIIDNSKKSVSLDELYFKTNLRKNSYASISAEIVKIAKAHDTTCFVTYGHPLVLSNTSTKLIKEIEDNNQDITIDVLPGISSLDTLLCDLKFDPGTLGLQVYESTAFINGNYNVNTNSHLILWQIGISGVNTIIKSDDELLSNIERKNAIAKLKDKLLGIYNKNHSIVLYVAGTYPSIPFTKEIIYLNNLDSYFIPRLATAYVPPLL